MYAVITGDIVNSTRLKAGKEKVLLRALTAVFDGQLFEFYRGDSFQACLPEAATALHKALQCRAIAISMAGEDETLMTDVRLSIGIGKVELPVTSLKNARGEAFILSGRRFDELKEERLAISSSNPLGQAALQVTADYINSIFAWMTAKQAEVIVELLQGKQQQDIAQQLNKTKSTIHQRVMAGRWPEIEKLESQYQQIIQLLS